MGSEYGFVPATATWLVFLLSMSMGPRVNAADLDWLTAQYPIVAVRGPVTLGSDISRLFTDTHADHAKKCWDYYGAIFARSAGNRTEIYYSYDQGKFDDALSECPAFTISGGRQLTACWAGDHRKWFLVPFEDPDFKTLTHELSHDWLFATYMDSANYPWIMEGSGMYFESGEWDGSGNLVVTEPIPWYRDYFLDHHSRGRLIALNTLVHMSRSQFYNADPCVIG